MNVDAPHSYGCIASPEFLNDYPELHHYTTFDGLKGIISTSTVWATHYKNLNDRTEASLIRPYLIRAVEARYRSILRSAMQTYSLKRVIRELGGVLEVASHDAEKLVGIIFDKTFGLSDEPAFGAPFIASFCSHSRDSEYEQENGLLSQWRGYANGGYCIVFHSAGIAALLEKEKKTYSYAHLDLSPVRYLKDDIDIAALVPILIDRCENYLRSMMNKQDPTGSMGDAFNEFIAATTLVKHRGFEEEREVRIVAAPSSHEISERIRLQNPDLVHFPLKKIHSIARPEGDPHSHIILFEGLNEPLPISRVIVGPTDRQEENRSRAMDFIGNMFPIVCSQTPFIG